MRTTFKNSTIIKNKNMRNNNRKRTSGRKYAQKPLTKLIGTSIMVVHGSDNFENAPYEVYNGKKLNRLCFIPFLFESNPNKSRENNRISYLDALSQHYENVDKVALKKYADFETYTLDKIMKTSAIVNIYA